MTTHHDRTLPLPEGRRLELPDDWAPVEETMLETALQQTRLAFTGEAGSLDYAVKHVLAYYDPAGKYAGATFLAAGPLDDDVVTAADLWAVSTLSMTIPARTGRALIDDGELKTTIEHQLHLLQPTLELVDATAYDLAEMATLQHAIRTGVPALGKRATNQWVLAAKICARKRPLLFPVRDSLVCTYLANNPAMGGKPGQLGWFTRDIQVFAFLMAHRGVRDLLAELREAVRVARPTWTFDRSDLRLLDVVLWMTAKTVTASSVHARRTDEPDSDGAGI